MTVHVFGALSGQDRDGISVRLYDTENDARDEASARTGSLRTNNDGDVTFGGLSSGRVYWVRADALLVKTIRETPTLEIGDNYFEIPIL